MPNVTQCRERQVICMVQELVEDFKESSPLGLGESGVKGRRGS